jgi:hypothetical protein
MIHAFIVMQRCRITIWTMLYLLILFIKLKYLISFLHALIVIQESQTKTRDFQHGEGKK